MSDSDVFGLPTQIEFVGRYLVVADIRAEPALHVLSPSSGRLLGSLGRRGRGPGEFVGRSSLDPVPGREEVWLWDLTERRFTHIDLNRYLAEPRRLGERSLNLTVDIAPINPVWMGDSLIVSPGFLNSNRFARFDPDGKLLGRVGEDPPGDRSVPTTVRQHAYQLRVKPNPARTLLAAATRYADRLDIYNAAGQRIASGERPHRFEPNYTIRQAAGRPTMAYGADMRYGYLDLAVTEHFIYALFSGRTGREHRDPHFGEHVYVFDWNGRLRQRLKLDTSVINITVDPRTSTLYGVRHDPVPAILKYQLPH